MLTAKEDPRQAQTAGAASLHYSIWAHRSGPRTCPQADLQQRDVEGVLQQHRRQGRLDHNIHAPRSLHGTRRADKDSNEAQIGLPNGKNNGEKVRQMDGAGRCLQGQQAAQAGAERTCCAGGTSCCSELGWRSFHTSWGGPCSSAEGPGVTTNVCSFSSTPQAAGRGRSKWLEASALL